jgi:hypothetical protein
MESTKSGRSEESESSADSFFTNIQAAISRRQDVIYGDIESEELVHEVESTTANGR